MPRRPPFEVALAGAPRAETLRAPTKALLDRVSLSPGLTLRGTPPTGTSLCQARGRRAHTDRVPSAAKKGLPGIKYSQDFTWILLGVIH